MERAIRMLSLAAAFALACGGAAAQTSDAALLADRAGFLVGHAHRCGVEIERLERSKAVVDRLIAAYAADGADEDAAQTRFGERVLASALAEFLGDMLPSCDVVRAQLARFEQHRSVAAPRPGRQPDGGKPDSARIARDKPARVQPSRAATTID